MHLENCKITEKIGKNISNILFQWVRDIYIYTEEGYKYGKINHPINVKMYIGN